MNSPTAREKLQKGIYRIINPFVRLLIRMGFTANTVTVIGFILNMAVAVIFIVGAEEGNRGDFSYVGWAGSLTLFAGLFDMLDGQVARLGKMSSSFGALFDSVLDRYSELFLFLGICYYLVAHHYFLSSLTAFIALIGSMMVSYTRARAEGLGIQCKDGLMQRPERVILIGLAAISCGIFSHYAGGNYKLFVHGIPFHVFETMSIFTLPIAVMAILTNITAIGRLRDAKKSLDRMDKQKSRPAGKMTVLLLALICLTGSAVLANCASLFRWHQGTPGTDVDTFPVPKAGANHLFYLQRSPNANTIICELNVGSNGQLNKEEPLHIFWIRYTEKGVKKELSFIQRVFAYGVQTKSIGQEQYSFHFVSYKKMSFLLQKSDKDKHYHVYASIGQKKAILTRIFIKINGGSMWNPNVEYIELRGKDPDSNKELMEKLKVS